MPTNYRVFISYRGNTRGHKFAKSLYKYLHEDPYSLEKYGEIYFSEEVERSENFITSIPRVMADVEYFILPLTEGFFSDFKEQGNDSVTYQEINAALQNEKMQFLAVSFDGFQFDRELITDLFGDDADKIWGCKKNEYDNANEMKTICDVADEIVQKTFTPKSIRDFEKKYDPNIRLAFKRDTENSIDYPYYEKLYDVQRITLMNFAATTFMAGYDIATIYQSSEYMHRWFLSRLEDGKIEVEAVLTNPYSQAAIDAEQYKMFPNGIRIPKSEIIIHNLNSFYKLKESNPNIRMRIYLTNISLPYGLMITEHQNYKNNHIKVDMYAPVPGEDRFRPSFYLLEDNSGTREIYHFFKNNLIKVMQEYSMPYDGHPDTRWLLNKHIIHKAKINDKVIAHTKAAYAYCMKRNYPIEVDLVMLKDGNVVVGRQDELANLTGNSDITQMDWRQLKEKINETAKVDISQILRLKEFLEYIHGVIPILLEIKSNDYCIDSDKNQVIVGKVVKEVRKYIRKYGIDGENGKVAIHSSNPYILRGIRDLDCMIPIGQISLSFDSGKYANVGELQKKLHREQSYFGIITPDFMCYDICDLPNPEIQNHCGRLGIPLIGWTIKDADNEEFANDCCQSIIIEGSSSYL